MGSGLKWAEAQLPWQSGVGTPVTAAAFTGVGDVLSGAKAHYGSIAYSAASRGSNMYSICDASTAGTCKDIATSASTGLVSSTQGVGSIGTCGTGASQCYIDKAYDDSGGLNCTGSVACTIIAPGTRPKFIVNASGTVPGIGCDSRTFNNGTFTNIAQPFSHLVSASVPSDPGTFSTVSANSASVQVGFGSGTVPFAYAGSVLSAGSGVSTATFYALIGVLNGASGDIYVNGTSNPGSTSTNATTAQIDLCSANGANPSAGTVLEEALYPSAVTTSVSSLTSTMRTNGGGF